MADAPENTSESTARDYRDTVFLPETPFPMRGGLPQKEPVILEQWGDLYGTLRAERRKQNAPLYVLHDGPPYANGDIHIGHALNKILKDVITRSFQMQVRPAYPDIERRTVRNLAPGDFFAMGPALSATPVLAHIDPTITEHLGKTPELRAAASVDADEAAKLLDLAGLAEVADHGPAIALKGTRALDAFLLDPVATDAAAIMDALKRISPNASTARDLARHLSLDAERTDRALNLLSAIAAVDTMPKGDDRIARLHARLRARLSDVAVVSL